MTDETLTQAFKQFRSFGKAKIIRERWNNKTKGYGFVSFADSADMVACMKTMNGETACVPACVPACLPACPPARTPDRPTAVPFVAWWLRYLTALSLRLIQYTGKYIGNRPCKLRKSTWDERSTTGGKTMGPSKKSRGNKHMSKRFKGTMTH